MVQQGGGGLSTWKFIFQLTTPNPMYLIYVDVTTKNETLDEREKKKEERGVERGGEREREERIESRKI